MSCGKYKLFRTLMFHYQYKDFTMNQLECMNKEQNEINEDPNPTTQESVADAGSPIAPEEVPVESILAEEQIQAHTGEELHVQGSESSQSEVDSAKHGAHRQHFDKFLADLKNIPDNESKLQFTIDFMEASIAQVGSPHFKSFWEARNVCLEIFKENISPTVRWVLWNKYNELSKEARRLKEILDEQSAFAVEQIEIAITALESEIINFDEQVGRVPPLNFNVTSQVLQNHLPEYEQIQLKLNLLNTQASRINALRKELIRTEMRVRQKNKFFQRLSVAGDKVFPVRKDLIKNVSDRFIADVDAFIANNFNSETAPTVLFSLREEIKALQSVAKLLTLNTHSFTHTRMRLSECWDHIKGEEKERKKERSQLKSVYKQNFDEGMQKLKTFTEGYQSHQINDVDAAKQIDEMGVEFRALELERDKRQLLREEFNAARKLLTDKVQNEEKARNQKENERENQRRNKIQETRKQIEAMLIGASNQDVESLTTQRDEIVETLTQLAINKAERIEIDRQLKLLRDIISEKKESSLLSLSDDDRQSLQNLKQVLGQRRERARAIKEQIETLRRSNSSSGRNFSQAIDFSSQMAEEKERLDKINLSIKEIEDKIKELQK